jgi:diguanylate cyclase (GGDEF)-like protein
VVRDLLQRGVLRPVGQLKTPTGKLRLHGFESSPRVYDLRPLLQAPPETPPRAFPDELSPPDLTPSIPADRPSPGHRSVSGATGSSEGEADSTASVTLGAIRRTFQRDWVSFGLDASLENLLGALREALGDSQLHLLLWGDRLPLQLGEGQAWEVAGDSHSLGLALKQAQARALPVKGMVVQGRRWFPLWLQDQQMGALGADPGVEPSMVEEAAGAVRDLIAAASRSQHRVFSDPLTGVHNRGYFDRQFSVEMERSRRSGAPLALLFADLDHFKRINDEHGHEAGDLVLRNAASLFVAHLRRIDYVFRYGGEEFALLLPGTEAREAHQTAERLRARVEETGVTLSGGQTLHVTVSLGVAVFPEHGDQERTLLRRADLAMYQAKESGRNRVVMWGEIPD